MAVGLVEPVRLEAVPGVRLGTARSGARRPAGDDVVLIELTEGAHCAAVFTRNAFCAAPVVIARTHLGRLAPRYLLVNAGNANAGMGEQGLHDAVACCKAVAHSTHCDAGRVLPFSTGVIGERLAVDALSGAIPQALATLRADGWMAAAHAIRTTDTLAKGASRQVALGSGTVTVTGICKGSGMIRPDMATMLAFMATDASIEPSVLQHLLAGAVDQSFNRITVDGDTSTNDACVLIASGESPVVVDSIDAEHYAVLARAVLEVSQHLAQSIVRDAEGATKFISVRVERARDEAEALRVAYTIAHSPLVKTAFFASDANWGRILAAVGRAGVSGLQIERVNIHLNDLCIVRHGERDAGYTEAAGQRVMSGEEITVTVSLGGGTRDAAVWTSDLSHEYVRINAEYRT